jgi:hypothetical protein
VPSPTRGLMGQQRDETGRRGRRTVLDELEGLGLSPPLLVGRVAVTVDICRSGSCEGQHGRARSTDRPCRGDVRELHARSLWHDIPQLLISRDQHTGRPLQSTRLHWDRLHSLYPPPMAQGCWNVPPPSGMLYTLPPFSLSQPATMIPAESWSLLS